MTSVSLYIYPLLETVHRIIKHRKIVTKEQVEEAVCNGLLYHYSSFQARPDQSDEEAFRIESYLLKNIKVLIDEDAWESMQTKDYDHGAWFIDLESGHIGSY